MPGVFFFDLTGQRIKRRDRSVFDHAHLVDTPRRIFITAPPPKLGSTAVSIDQHS